MLAGFAAAFLVGDMFLAVRGAAVGSVEFVVGVAGFSLAQALWSVGQLREAKPDVRVFIAAAVPLAMFALVRLRPPVLPPSAAIAVFSYSVMTAVSFATALATRRALYICGIGLLLFSDLMIGGRFLKMPGCSALVGPAYIAAELCLLASFAWSGEWRLRTGRVDIWRGMLVGGLAAFACFTVAAFSYPGGGYNPLMKMLSALGETCVRGVEYPACHYWFMAGMFLSAASVGSVWIRLSRQSSGWRRAAVGWGGAANVAGLLSIALVPYDASSVFHNLSCNIAVLGGAAIIAARLRKGADLAWSCWFLALVAFFTICLDVKAIPFSPWVTATQKALIVSFAVWAGWLAKVSTHGRDFQ